jgi:hypothetical protein
MSISMRIRNTVVAMLAAGILLLSASGVSLAAGKLGGASGADEFRSSLDGPMLAAGKLGDASGID